MEPCSQKQFESRPAKPMLKRWVLTCGSKEQQQAHVPVGSYLPKLWNPHCFKCLCHTYRCDFCCFWEHSQLLYRRRNQDTVSKVFVNQIFPASCWQSCETHIPHQRAREESPTPYQVAPARCCATACAPAAPHPSLVQLHDLLSTLSETLL